MDFEGLKYNFLAPDPPDDFSITITSEFVNFNWYNPGMDSSFWNTDLNKSSTWHFMLKFGTMFPFTQRDTIVSKDKHEFTWKINTQDFDMYFGQLTGSSIDLYGPSTMQICFYPTFDSGNILVSTLVFDLGGIRIAAVVT